jgi:hypothetical protein
VLDDMGRFMQKSYSLVALPMKKFKRLETGGYEIPKVPSANLKERPVTYLDEALFLSLQTSSSGRKKNKKSDDKKALEFSSLDSNIDTLKEF